jgi:hypothetical protein
MPFPLGEGPGGGLSRGDGGNRSPSMRAVRDLPMAKTQKAALTTKFLNSAAAHARVFQLISHTNPLKCFPIVFAPKFASQVDHLKHIRSDVRISSCISLFPGFFIFIFLPTQLLFGRRLGVDATTFAKRARDLAPGDHNESRDAFASPSDSPRARRTRTGERRRGSARRTPAFGRPRARAIASRPRGFPLPRGDGRGAFRVVIVGSGH